MGRPPEVVPPFARLSILVNQQVAEAFKKLYFTKRTGVLTCEAGAVRRAVYFNSGFVVGARSSLEADRLGEVMMRYGRITRAQFEDASHFIKSGWKLGEILAELNIIGEEEIEPFVRLQLLDIACTQLITPPKRLSFSNLTTVDSYVGAPLSVADILMEAARRAPALDKEMDSLLSDRRKLGFPKDPLKRFQDVNLKPEEAFVLSRVDGTQTAKDIFTVSPLSEEITARTLIGLLKAELIEPVGDEASKEPKEKPRSRSGVAGAGAETPSAPSGAGLRARGGRATVPGVPFAQSLGGPRDPPGLGARRDSAGLLSAGRNGSIPTASGASPRPNSRRSSRTSFGVSPKRRRSSPPGPRPDTKRSPTKKGSTRPRGSSSIPSRGGGAGRSAGDAAEATSLFRRAHAGLSKSSDFWNAIQLCHQAIDQAPERAEAYHLLGLALSKNPKWRQDAEKNLRIATNLDPWKADYFRGARKPLPGGGSAPQGEKSLRAGESGGPDGESARRVAYGR